MDDKEFLSLDLEGARDYALAWATTLKQYEKEIALLDQDIATWRNRITLAESQSRPDLAEGARGRLAEIETRRGALESERAAVAADLVRVKERIPYLHARERSIDPDRLLAELQLMTGSLLEPDKASTEEDLAETEKQAGADEALAALKRKMQGEA
jgi:predicted  nucleic acid-binding Zn-ribbon protein